MTSKMSLTRWHRWVAAFLLSATIANGVVLWQQRFKMIAGYGDFSALYTAGLMLRRGLGHQLYDRREQWKIQQEFASRVETRKGPQPFIRPPFDALVFLPLSWLSYPAALAVWSLVKLACLLLATWILQRPFGRIYPAWLEPTLCLGMFPFLMDFMQGQDAIFLLLLVVLAFNCVLARRDTAAGVYLGLGLFKFNLMLPMVLLLSLSGHWRVLRGFAPVAAALVALSVFISGPNVLLSYPAYLARMNRAENVGFIHAQTMPNLRGLLTAAVGVTPYPGPIHWILLPIAMAVLAYAAHLWRSQVRETRGMVLGFCLSLLVSILTGYYAYLYDMMLLLVPLLVLSANFLDQSQIDAWARRFLVCGFLLLLCTPLYGALFLWLDRGYLLSLAMIVVAIGLVRAMKHPAPGPL